jgi:site-specific DNA-methyltransferase (adenine-specific)
MSWNIHHGDCREVMATLDAESVDAIVCDPPYGLSFMGKEWDSFKPGDIAMRRNPAMDAVNAGASRQGGRQRACSDYQKRQRRDMLAFQEAMESVFLEALRVAKPGAHLLAFGGTRTYHRLACAIEDAGWEIRDCVMWVYGSGFPKSHDVSKAIDKAAGAERGRKTVRSKSVSTCYAQDEWTRQHGGTRLDAVPITDASREWQGWGTALKPAWEPIIVARKPLVGTVAENVLTHGTGGINVDGCRVASSDQIAAVTGKATLCGTRDGYDRPWKHDPEALAARQERANAAIEKANTLGRWPANLIHDGSDEVVGLFPVTGASKATPRNNGDFKSVAKGRDLPHVTYGHDDNGGSAARFFYCAKASRADRNEGCDGIPERRSVDDDWVSENRKGAAGGGKPSPQSNHHPTVKPTDLMRYLCRLVTPPGGVVLDPFTGSGSTGKGAILEGFRFIGIEREAEYVEIAKARIAAVEAGAGPLFT